MRKRLLLGLAALCGLSATAQVAADFTASEAMTTYYSQGFDSQEEADTWTYKVTNSGATWKPVEAPAVTGIPPFSSIDPDSKMSLGVYYSNSYQNEVTTSPEVEVRPGSSCEFYCCFGGGFMVFARWTFSVTDVESGEETTLIDGFNWSQENDYTGPSWQKFNADLSEYAGKKVKFSFTYVGTGGEDVLVDGFKVKEADTSADATVSINEGGQVSFINTSANATSYAWEFPGGEPATSTEQNPTVAYSTAGVYDVILTASDGADTSKKECKGYVVVSAQAPSAKIGLPSEGYLSPWVGVFVPTQVPVTFRDESTGKPDAWEWTFQGTDITSSSEQNPTVTYTKEGTYSVGLTATNSAGASQDVLQYAVQAGGSQYVWNISPEENQELEKIALGWYGNYAGTNWLDIYKFAEHFDKPLAKAEIESVAVYFASNKTVTPDAEITVEVFGKGADGLPGDLLASGKCKASELKFEEGEYLETLFPLDKVAVVEDEFFVAVGGFPNNTDDATYETDDIAIYCHRRELGEKPTTYNYLAELDENYEPTGKNYWIKNSDEAVSMAVAPILKYATPDTPPAGIAHAATADGLSFDGRVVRVPEGTQRLDIYTVNGQLVESVVNPSDAVGVERLAAGLYIVKAGGAASASVIKIVKK